MRNLFHKYNLVQNSRVEPKTIIIFGRTNHSRVSNIYTTWYMFYQPSVTCCTMLSHFVTLRRWWMKTRAGLANQNIEVTRRGLQDRCRFGETATRHVSFNPSDCPTLGRTSGWKAAISRQRPLTCDDLCSRYSPFILNTPTVLQTARRISVNDKLRCSYPTRYDGNCQTNFNLTKEQL